MAQARFKQVFADRVNSSDSMRLADSVAVEEPLQIRLGDTLVSTTMRTPGNDFELAAGFCRAEGLLHGGQISSIRYCATAPATETDFNIVSVEATGNLSEPRPRLGTTTSACGICGAESIQKLLENLEPLDPQPVFTAELLKKIPQKVRSQQELFDRTGGVHAAAACDASGSPVLVREDIGRHNAVDKVVGRLLLDEQLPATNLCLFVSGRASFEILQKAWAGGFGTVMAVSAPSSLAVELAATANIRLAAFVRGDSLNFYA